MELTPEKSSGLDRIFVAWLPSAGGEVTVAGVTSSFSVEKFSNMGGAYAQPVDVALTGSEAAFPISPSDMGYILTDSGKSTYIWIVNYADHILSLYSCSPAPEQNCDETLLDVSGHGEAIKYYTIDGRPIELDREIKLSYRNLEWDESSVSFLQKDCVKMLPHISPAIGITPPLYADSRFTLTGDRFLEFWGMSQTVHSDLVKANGIATFTSAEQLNSSPDTEEGEEPEPSNQIRTENSDLGGSAPAQILFKSFNTDAVAHTEWQVAQDADFEYIDYRFNEPELDYTFEKEGTFYVRFIASNNDGTCEAFGDTYSVSIGSSELRIPNAFSPNGDGVNDIWKVGYRSLLNFRCTIFDRYGTEIFSFSDPSSGWDGTYKGKQVKPGVYFYVIEAVGADGKKYKKGGDINIIRSKRFENSTPVE